MEGYKVLSWALVVIIILLIVSRAYWKRKCERLERELNNYRNLDIIKQFWDKKDHYYRTLRDKSNGSN